MTIITNGSNLTDLNKAEETVKNIENASLINKNVLVTTITSVVIKIKDRKPLSNIKGNRKLLYKGLNYKSVDKRNLKYYKYSKKCHFKSECWSKSKDRMDY